MDQEAPPVEHAARRDLGSAAFSLGASIGFPNFVDVLATVKLGPLVGEVAALPPPAALVLFTARARFGVVVPVRAWATRSGRDVEWTLGAMFGGTWAAAPLELTTDEYRALGGVVTADYSVWIRPRRSAFVRFAAGADRWSGPGPVTGRVDEWSPAVQVAVGLRWTDFLEPRAERQ